MTDTRNWIDLLERREREAEALEALEAIDAFPDRARPQDHLGSVVARARRAAGVSREQLASRLDTTPSVLEVLESSAGEGHGLDMLRRIAEVLEMDLHVGFTPRR